MDTSINSYDYKPDFNFFKTGNERETEKKLFVGFELEAERHISDLNDYEIAEELSNIVNKDKQFIYFKHDGSLDEGIEIVSMPFTLDYLYDNQEKIKEMLQCLIDNEYKSHDTSTCGLHFHINKEYFGETDEEIDDNINKIILFTEYYKNNIIQLSRRSYFNYCHFLSDCNYYENIEDCNLIKIKKDKFGTDRYMVVNIKNTDTVEIRVIKGTLNFNSFMAAAEFIFSLAKVIKNNKIENISWDDVINYEGNKFLQQYCIDRKIEPSSKKMKDYSIKFIKEQIKLKNKIGELERDISKKMYEILKFLIKDLSLEYDKMNKNVPERYSIRFNPSKILDKNEENEKRYSIINAILRIYKSRENLNVFAERCSSLLRYFREINHKKIVRIINKKFNEEIYEMNEEINKLIVIMRKVDDV